MSSKQISPLLRTWYKWKALRLPWRKRFLVGLDLQGNTYWEFRDARHGPAELARWRRIVQYPRDTHYGEVKVSPQWHQWLRHMRERPPSVREQHTELQRQQQMKHLAAEADARWDAKPRVMDAPGEGAAAAAAVTTGQPVPMLESSSSSSVARAGGAGAEAGAASAEEQVAASGSKPKHNDKTGTADPWKRHPRAGPSEDWQPQAWAPPASKR